MKIYREIGGAVIVFMLIACDPPLVKSDGAIAMEQRDLELRDSLRHAGRDRDRNRHDGRHSLKYEKLQKVIKRRE